MDDAKNTFITRENNKKTAGTSLRPTRLTYSFNYEKLTAALGEYASLLLPNGANTNYWLASRATNTGDEEKARFFIRLVGQGKTNNYFVAMTSDGETTAAGVQVFPIIELKSGTIADLGNGKFSFEPMN